MAWNSQVLPVELIWFVLFLEQSSICKSYNVADTSPAITTYLQWPASLTLGFNAPEYWIHPKLSIRKILHHATNCMCTTYIHTINFLIPNI